MIESIHFKNFKALRDATLRLSPFTLLVGPNGSGKSTVLQALEALSDRRRYEFPQVVTAGLHVDGEAESVEVSVKWGEPHPDVEPLLEWNRGTGVKRGNRPGTSGYNLVDRLLRRIRVYYLDADAIARPVPLAKDMEMAHDGGGLSGVLTRLQDQHRERFEAFNEETTRWLPEFNGIQFDVDTDGNRVLQLRTREGHHVIPAADLSQGTLLALAILTLAYLPEPPPLVGLEEPDRGLHPYLLRRVKDAIYRLAYPEDFGESRDPVQVIATTHSPYFLDLFKDRPEEIVVANKRGLDAEFQRLSDQPHIREVLGEAALGEVWYTGILGGVPAPP